MFTIDNSIVDFESGEEAVKVLFDDLGEDFLKRYNKIKDIVMQKRIGTDYLLSRKVNCSHPAFRAKYPNMDDDMFSLLTTDLLIRGEAIIFLLKKQTGIDVMKRYHEIKKSIYKRELKRKKLIDKINELRIREERIVPIEIYQFLPFLTKNVTKIVMCFINGIKNMYSMVFRNQNHS